MNDMRKVETLKQFTDDELKAEIQRRRTLERARRHLPSAEEALKRAQEKVDRYRQALADDDLVERRRAGARRC